MSLLMVYVAGPFSAPTREGVEENISKAEQWGVELAKLGVYPMIPHANTSHIEFEQVQPYEFWIEGTIQMLRCCDAIFLTPGWEKSSGARGERDEAIRMNIPRFDDLQQVAIWLLDKKKEDEL